MSREEIGDVATILATLLLLPFIVHMLHAPMIATFCVAIVCWPVTFIGGIVLIITISKSTTR